MGRRCSLLTMHQHMLYQLFSGSLVGWVDRIIPILEAEV